MAEQNYTTSNFMRNICISNFGLMSQLIRENLGITFAYEAILKNQPYLSPFYIEGLNIVRDFNYVYLDNPNSISIVNKFKEIL